MKQQFVNNAASSVPRVRFGSWGGYLPWIIAIIVVAVLPLILKSSHSVSMLSQMGIAIVFALSYNMLLGQGGMLSFGHAVYFGLGGFFAIHALNMVGDGRLSIPLELIPLVGALGGLLFAIPFGWVSTKRSGTSFAMISLGLGELVAASSLMFTGFFGGEGGISGNRVTDITLLPYSYGPAIEVYYLIAAWAVISAALMYLLTQTPLGRMANAVRDNPERAEFVGYNPRLVRFFQFSLAGLFAGVAGGLYAISYELLTAENLGAVASGTVLLATFIGGVGYFFGPILGAMLITYLQTTLSTFSKAWILYFGLIFVFIVMFAPQGLAGIIMLHRPAWKAGLMSRLLPSYALAVIPVLLFLGGVVALIEMGYHFRTNYDPSEPMGLFGMKVVVTQVMPWIVAVAVTLVGAVLCRLSFRRINAAWADVDAILAGEKR